MNTEQHAAAGPEFNAPGNELVPKEQSPLSSLREPALGDLWKKELQDLQAIAAQVQSVGARQVIYGRAMVNQQRLDTVMQTLTAGILALGRKRRNSRGNIASIAQLTHCLAQLSGKSTDSLRVLLEMEKPSGANPDPISPPTPLVPTFAPGQMVGPGYGLPASADSPA